MTPAVRAASCAGLLVAFLARAAAAQGGGFRHDRWDRLLRANVTAEGWVSYESFRGKDSAELKAYLKEIAEADQAKVGTKDDQKAFWINAYNAVCIQTLIDAGLPAEVPHAAFFGRNIFTQRTYRVAGELRSLDDIEHGILRKEYKDPRLHAAVVCGARSCPRLRPEAYVGERLDKQLDEECTSWIQLEKTKNGERKNRLDAGTGIYHVSKIFVWYAADFDGEKGVKKFLAKYASAEDRAYLEKNHVQLKYLTYDWSSNRQ